MPTVLYKCTIEAHNALLVGKNIHRGRGYLKHISSRMCYTSLHECAFITCQNRTLMAMFLLCTYRVSTGKHRQLVPEPYVSSTCTTLFLLLSKFCYSLEPADCILTVQLLCLLPTRFDFVGPQAGCCFELCVCVCVFFCRYSLVWGGGPELKDASHKRAILRQKM